MVCPTRADVVGLAFDRQQRRAADRAQVNAAVAYPQHAASKLRFPKHAFNRLKIKLGRQVEYGKILIVKGLDRLRLRRFAGRKKLEQLNVRLHVSVGVIDMNASSCMKPGYTRRPTPR